MKKYFLCSQIFNPYIYSNENTAMCMCKSDFTADKVTFNRNGEMVFVNSIFSSDDENREFQNYTSLCTDMEKLDDSNLKSNNNNNEIYLYVLKVGFSPNGYYCFKYNDKIYILREEQGKYLLPVAEKENNSFKEKIDWVCVLGSDKNEQNEITYFLLKGKFDANKGKAIVLDDFLSKNKFKSKNEKMKVQIIDENAIQGKNNNGKISINNNDLNITINIGSINTINTTQNVQQDIKILKK